MKQLIQTLFFVLLITQISFAQWYQQNSGTTSHLRGVSFTDANNGTAVGEYGTILRTTNGGVNWSSQTSGTTLALMGTSFTDENTGTAVGGDAFTYEGIIIRTIDGGNTWTSQIYEPLDPLCGVSFTDANNGTAVGIWAIILRTSNGGATWTFQWGGTTLGLWGVSFTDENTGTAVGYNGTILRTTDGGATWTPQTSGTPYMYGLNGVSFTNVNNGTVVGDSGTIIRTTDGGANWLSQTSGTTSNLFGVSFTDANNGTAVGDYGTILRTTNGGTTWTSQTSGTTTALFGVSFTDANTGTVVGGWGTILRTWNGGVPVEFTSFTASVNKNNVLLNWSTATELNNQGFEIERASSKTSPRQEDWEKIGFVPGFGTTTEPKSYSYTDQSVNTGINYYRLKQVDYNGSYEYSDVIEVDYRTFNSYLLEQNYPNPFNPTTTIGFGIQNKSNVKITILNAIGEEVAVILNEEKDSGYHTVEFNAANLPSGVYFYQLQAGSFVETKKMVLMK